MAGPPKMRSPTARPGWLAWGRGHWVLLRLGAGLLGLLAASRVAHAGDPTLAWRTLATPHFEIHFFDPLEPVARKVAAAAEQAHRALVPVLGHAPREICHIVLRDDTDGANGFASVLPRNQITLYVTAPPGESVLGDHDDWLYALVAHEYTHILHLDTMAGLPTWVNAVFGKQWAPNQLLPRWLIEGIATYQESRQSAGGRTRASVFDMYLRVPVLAGAPLPLDVVTGAPRAYPRGNVAYLYGAHFLRYVFDVYGERALAVMSHAGGSHPVPYAVNRQMVAAVGKPFTELYDEWLGFLRDKYALQAAQVRQQPLREGAPLTHTGEANLLPRFTRDGNHVYWLQADGYTRARVRRMAVGPQGPDAATAEDVVAQEAVGGYDVTASGDVVFEQTRLTRREYAFQDLHRWAAATGEVQRLTHGARAREPAVSPDGRWVAYSGNHPEGSALLVRALDGEAAPRVVWRGAPFEQAYQPAWSPDGARVAFSAWRTGGYRDILVIELATGATHAVTHDRALDGAPAFAPDGSTVYFHSDRSGISNIYAHEFATGQTWQVTNVLGGAFAPAVSPNGQWLVFQRFGLRGFDLATLRLEPQQHTPAAPYLDDRPAPTLVTPWPGEVRPYRAWRTLAPQTWRLQGELGTLAQRLTAQTEGSDVVGLHAYSAALTVGVAKGDVAWGVGYLYNGWRPSLRLSTGGSVQHLSGFRIDGVPRPYTQGLWQGALTIGLPTEVRPDAAWSVGVGLDADYRWLMAGPAVPRDPVQYVPEAPRLNYWQAGLVLRGSYGNLRGTTFSLGPERGYELGAGVRLDHPAVGATYRELTVDYLTRGVTRLPWGRTPTFMWRVMGGWRAGDLFRNGGFGLGGMPTQDLVGAITSTSRVGNTGYLRGYAARTVAGNQYHLGNFEYRHELAIVERGLATLPVYVKRLHGALLLDAGTAWDGAWGWAKGRVALGAVLRLDAVWGYFAPGTLELGYAHGLTSHGIHETWLLLSNTL